MKNWIIMFMALLPVIGEIIYDRIMWNKGKDDKPSSTWLRAFAFIWLAMVAATMLPWNYLLSTLFAGLFFWATHYLLFNPMLNLARPGKSIGYRKRGEWWYEKPWEIEYFVKIWLWYVSWLLLFKWDLVQGHYITNGTWWEKISQFITF